MARLSRFKVDVLLFLRSKLMRLYITFPDATALLQLLDQVNQSFRCGYRRAKSELFTSVMTINRGSLMTILEKIWADWTIKEALINASRRVWSDTISSWCLFYAKWEVSTSCCMYWWFRDEWRNHLISHDTYHRFSLKKYERVLKTTTRRSLNPWWSATKKMCYRIIKKVSI